jgi:hypothetical protein
MNAAIANPKCAADVPLLNNAKSLYFQWITDLETLTTEGKLRVISMVNLLNEYKDVLEVDLIMKHGSDFLRRQKGQLKLDNSILEEFLIHVVKPSVLKGLGNTQFVTGPQNAFMSLSFRPRGFSSLDQRPEVVLKTKDQDFVIGSRVHYRLSASSEFQPEDTAAGSFVLAVLAAECKVNLDKTMFQEAAGTATRMKLGCPVSKYFILAEYLDMQPEDCRLTDIDNVFLLRHAKRLPFEKRHLPGEVEQQHKEFPIDSEVIWRFVEEIQGFVDTAWYDPDEALRRSSFI